VETLPLNGSSERRLLADEALKVVVEFAKKNTLSGFPVRDIVIASIYTAGRRIGIPLTPYHIKEAYDDKAIWNNSWVKTLKLMEKYLTL